ncbi:hypothetical protein [Breznakia pachnodae]|uniref:Uncharacterized protein n=1 Tax=Breznakia pachnodae TaxID=265178 RepID=A0ABU0E8E9_9FIRM|nr:hypothetical protein [Breznakia pachnodae]MDQ0363160.1 hypothetical protein [Breznakia pachnodae]
MKPTTITKHSKIINILLIITSLSILTIWTVFEVNTYYISTATITMLDSANLVYKIISGILLLYSSVIFYNNFKNTEKIDGLLYMLIASIFMLILSLLNVVYGILIWMLAGVSLYRLIKQTKT